MESEIEAALKANGVEPALNALGLPAWPKPDALCVVDGCSGAQTAIAGGELRPSCEPLRQRRYLPTFSDLVDRLSIVQMKVIFIPERREEYAAEIADILHDLDLILDDTNHRLGSKEVRAMLVIMLSNRFIWENESLARQGDNSQDKRLKLTHSINGVRNTAKNVLAACMGGRQDYKVDCFASELVQEFGDWNVFNGGD